MIDTECLTDTQRRLLAEVQQLGGWDGRDLRDVLLDLDAPAADKVAVAEALGGLGAGDEFRA